MWKYVHFFITMVISALLISFLLHLPWQGFVLLSCIAGLVACIFILLHMHMDQ